MSGWIENKTQFAAVSENEKHLAVGIENEKQFNYSCCTVST